MFDTLRLRIAIRQLLRLLHKKFSLGRCFCVTENEYMRLVPPQSEPGDVVVIFLGAQVTHVLREEQRQEERPV